MKRSEIKAQAKKVLSNGKWAYVFLAILIVGLITGISSVLSILALPLSLGLLIFIKKMIQTQEADFESIFSPYKDINRAVNILCMYLLTAIFVMLWSLLFLIPGIVKAYSYSLAPYLMMEDPSLGPVEAIKKSQELMRGHKWERFVLDLSFIGWVLLSMLTFGVLYIYVLPYMQTTQEIYCLNLIPKKEAPIEAEATVSDAE